MIYDLQYTEKFWKQISKLPKDVQQRTVKKLERCRIRPHAFVKKLVSSPYFRIRLGDYRIIVDIQQGKLIILVLEIGHRKNIYQK